MEQGRCVIPLLLVCFCNAFSVTQSSHYRVQRKWPRFGGEKGVELHPALEGRYQVSADFWGTCAVGQVPLCSIASAYSRFQAPALKNNGVSNSILTTTFERGNP